LTATGVLFAGVTLGLNRSKIIKKFADEIGKGRNQLHDEVTRKLTDYTLRIRQKLEANFYEFDQLLENEGKKLNEVEQVQQEVRKDLKDLSKGF